jgi:hypothetical protein
MSKEKSEYDPNEAAADDVADLLDEEPSLSDVALQAALVAHPDADGDTVVAIFRKRKGLPPLPE